MRTPDGIAKRRQQDRERKRRKYLDDAFRAKEIERRRLHYVANRERELQRAKDSHERNKEHRNARRRKWSIDNPEKQFVAQQKCHRNRPASVAVRTTRELLDGRISIDEANQRLREAFVRSDGKDGKRSGSRYVRKSDRETNQTET